MAAQSQKVRKVGAREWCCAHMGGDVEVGVVNPYRTSFTEPSPADATPQDWRAAGAALDLIGKPRQTQLPGRVEPTWGVERSG